MVYRQAALLCLLCLGILLIAWWASARPPEPPSVAEAGHSSKPVVAAEPGDGEVRIEGDLMLGSGEPKVLELGTRTISSAGSSLEFEIRAVNATAETIDVETTISSCGCTNAETKDRTIVPAGATLVSGTIELRRPGPLYVSITLLDPDGGVVGRLVARAEVRLLDASVAVDGRWTRSPNGFEFRLVSTGATPPQGVHASYRGRDVPIEIVGAWTRLGGPELVGAASIWTATFRTSGVTEPAPWEPSLRVAADSGMSLRVVLPPSATVADRQTMSLGK